MTFIVSIMKNQSKNMVVKEKTASADEAQNGAFLSRNMTPRNYAGDAHSDVQVSCERRPLCFFVIHRLRC